MFAFGIIFHIVFVFSIFDIYFRSPIVHGMRDYMPPQASAKRLVLFVGAPFVAVALFSFPFLYVLLQVTVCAQILCLCPRAESAKMLRLRSIATPDGLIRRLAHTYRLKRGRVTWRSLPASTRM